MKRSVNIVLIDILLFCVCNVELLENGVARTPPMGWMSWGYYECSVECVNSSSKCLDQNLITTVVDKLYEEYIEAGYEYVIIDDCWSEMKRQNNTLVPDRTRFPRGMEYISKYIHDHDLKFGMYTSIGDRTCKGYPASLYHMEEDSKLFAKWEVDYLKVDGCFVGEEVLNEGYINLGEYLKNTGRPMVYSCSWPYYIKFIHKHEPNYNRIKSTCNMWRDFHDIFPYWENLLMTIKYYKSQYELMESHHGPGHWFDADMLLVGRGILTEGQSRIQMAVYCILSLPLIISCDMTKVSKFEKDLLTNMDLIAINQGIGKVAKNIQISEFLTLWYKPHEPAKGDMFPSWSFAFVNVGEKEETVVLTPSDYGMTNSDGYTVYDVFKKIFTSNITGNDSVTETVKPKDAVVLTLYPI